MDSGNSASLQSSSGVGDGGGGGGGEEVYDSRTESVFLNPYTHFNSLPILQPTSSSHRHQPYQPPSTFFDPSSFSESPISTHNSVYDLGSLWSRNINPSPMAMYSLDRPQNPYGHRNPVDGDTNQDTGQEKVGVTTKNPKKRTRASRRAPTTVLTTDTTNFRQMVQEFTGIPAAPFSASCSSPFSRRLDPYGGEITPLHPLRPSAQKIQLHQPSYLNSTTAASSTFQIHPSETHVFVKPPLNLSNLKSQICPFPTLSKTSLPQQGNVTGVEIQQTEHPNPIPTSFTTLKRRGQDEHLLNFEERNGPNGNPQNGVVSTKRYPDQLEGNDDAPWICPSD